MNTHTLDHLGLILVSGNDAAKFLQGQVTCDIREINAEQSRLGAWCNPKGRVLTTFRLFQYHDNFLLQIPRDLISTMLEGLQKYAVFFKTTLTDVSDQYIQLGCHDNLKLETINQVKLSDEKIFCRVSDEKVRFLIIAPKTSEFLFDHATLSVNDWKLREIISGVPTIYAESSGLFTPHQINYPAIQGVSFNKGCYTGQEIIARTQYLGKSKQQMYRVRFSRHPHLLRHPRESGDLLKNTPLQSFGDSHFRGDDGVIFSDQSEEPVGSIINFASEKKEVYQALAVIYNAAIQSSLFIKNHNNIVLEILDLPYTT